MRQQINLYQPAFYEQRTQLPARTAACLLGIVVAALFVWRIQAGRRVTQLEKEVQRMQVHQHRQWELAGAAGVAQAMRGNPVSLQAKARQLATQLGQRKRALELLRSGAAGTTRGFADRLEALARRRVDGVWLDHIVLGAAGGVSSLAGHTLDPNLVPRYFQALANEPALRGARFDEFRIGDLPDPGTASAADADSPSAGDAPGATSSKAPERAPGATRFRASSPAPPTPQTRSSS
jgi:hypothetical protein